MAPRWPVRASRSAMRPAMLPPPKGRPDAVRTPQCGRTRRPRGATLRAPNRARRRGVAGEPVSAAAGGDGGGVGAAAVAAHRAATVEAAAGAAVGKDGILRCSGVRCATPGADQASVADRGGRPRIVRRASHLRGPRRAGDVGESVRVSMLGLRVGADVSSVRVVATAQLPELREGMKLREYQSRALAAVRTAYKVGHRRVLLVGPTGSGKAVIAAGLAHSFFARGDTSSRAVLVAHRRELVQQGAAKLEAFGIPCGHSGAGASLPMQAIMAQTALARGEVPPAWLRIFDECHHYVADEWKLLLDTYGGDD